jgi:hypothetical protein
MHTNLVLQFNRFRHNFKDLLKHTEGKGKEFENFVREAAEIHLKNVAFKTYDVNYAVKQKWCDLTQIGKLNAAGDVLDLCGTEDVNIFNHLDDVTEFKSIIECKCKSISNPGEKLLQHEDRHDFDIHTEREICETLRGNIRDPQGHPRQLCGKCNTLPFCGDYDFPETTWILHFNIGNGEGKKINHTKFPETLNLGKIEWFKSYSSFWTPVNSSQLIGHSVSLHFIKKKPFYYDDVTGRGFLYLFDGRLLHPDAYLTHVVYIRQPPLRYP